MKELARLGKLPGQHSILLLSRALGSGGSERQLAETAKALRHRGWDVHVGCFREEGQRTDELRTAGIPVVRFPLTSFASPVSVVRALVVFGRYVVRHKIALTHSFDTPTIIFGAVAGRLFFRRVVLTSQRSYRTLFKKWEHTFLRFTDRIADGVVVNCQAIRSHLIEDEAVPAQRIRLCYNGLDTTKFFPARDKTRPEHLAGAFVIGTVCVLRPEKGLDVLITAFAAASPAVRNFRLLIVGSGVSRESLVTLADELGIRQHVVFEPDTSDVAAWVNRMDVFVLASRSEAFSNALMEAMACGTPVVASRVGGNPELVGENERGLLFESGDAAGLTRQLIRLSEDAALRTKLAGAAVSFIRANLTLEASGARMAEIYSEYLGTNPTVSSSETHRHAQATRPQHR